MFTLYMTPQAREHLKRQVSQKGSQNIIAFGVKPSGCSGFAWNVENITKEAAKQKTQEGIGKIYHDQDVQYFVATKDEAHLHESMVELVKEGLNQKLKIQAPQATNYCGCGKSFGFTTEKS